MYTVAKSFIRFAGMSIFLLLANISYAQGSNAPYCAKAIGKSAIYSLTTASSTDPISVSTFWDGKSGSTQITHDLRGIATYGDYAFVTDVGDTSQLHVLHLGDGYLYTIDLGGVQSVSAVSVDGIGNVYVTDAAQNSTAQMAMLSSVNWASPGASINYYSIQQQGFKGHYQVDIAGFSSASDKNSGAAMLSRATDIKGVEISEIISGSGVVGTSVFSTTGTPRAITTDNAGNAYSLYTKLGLDGITTSYILATRDGTLLGSYNFEGMGTDISWIAPATDGGLGALSVVGDSSSGKFTDWILTLTSSVPSSVSSIKLSDSASTGSISSADNTNKMLWAVSKRDGSVYGISTLSWANGAGVVIADDTIVGISSHAYVLPTTEVPEPSGLISLAIAGIGALGFYRKRK